VDGLSFYSGRAVCDWEMLVEWLEDLADLQAARQAYRVLKEAGGDREKAGWLRWDMVEGELG